MVSSIPEFWKLVVESRLLSADQCQRLGNEYARVSGAADQANVKTLAQWLISKRALTPYQATVLKAGHAGPFLYGQYKVRDRIDQGVLAGCFRAVHEPSSHPVLLRFVGGQANDGQPAWRDVVVQIQTHGAVTHPNLSRCFEAVELNSFKFAVLEPMTGRSLDEKLPAGKKVKVADACRVIHCIALGLATLHQAGLIHGDVRPQFIWLEPGGNAKLHRDPVVNLATQSIASSADPSGQVLVRADYMAPEMAQRGVSPDARSDVYSLGCTLYRLLSGQPPFDGGDLAQKQERHATQPAAPLEQFGVPQQIAQLVGHMLAKDPSARCASAAVVAGQLASLLDPAQLKSKLSSPPPSLVAYENWIRQQHNTSAAVATPSPITPTPITQDVDAPTVHDSHDAPSLAPVIADGDLKLKTAEEKSSVSARIRPKKTSKKNLIILGSSFSGATAFAVILFLMLSPGGGRSSNNGNEKGDSTTTAQNRDQNDMTDDGAMDQSNGSGSGRDNGRDGSSLNVVQVADDGKRLWASPTNGAPIDFSYVPLAVRVLLVARPADMLGVSEGQLVLRALGPDFQKSHEAWEAAAGVKLSEIEQLIVGLHDNDGQLPRPSFVVRLARPISESDLVRRWTGAGAKTAAGTRTTIYVAEKGWSFLIPPAGPDAEDKGNAQLFVMGSEEDMTEVANRGAAPPTMMAQMTSLCRTSDKDRHFTMIFSRFHIFNDEFQKFFVDEREKVLRPLRQMLDKDKLKAVMLSMHFGQQSYMEMRLQGAADQESVVLAKELGRFFEEMPATVETYVNALAPHPYWNPLKGRFPQQVWALYRNLRIGVEEGQGVINCWLPAVAPHNLIAGTELVIASAPGQVYTTVGSTDTTSSPQTIDELLAMTFNFQIASDDMINVMQKIQDEIGDTYRNLPFKFDIKILGSDLQLEGITQNQRVNDFNMSGKSLADVLTGVVMKANPVTTVKDPSEKDQKLVWVVAPDSPPDQQSILITTRKAAENKKYVLPNHFQQKPA